MLKTQQYLSSKNKSLDTLRTELGIRICEHETLPLVILNYGIDSVKTNPIAQECRGLVLEKDTWNLVARAFSRFFNWGEITVERGKFNWNSCHVQEKVDGSLGLLYRYQDQWRFNTRGSFGNHEIFQDFTWTDLFCQALGIKVLADLDTILPKHYNITYVFEIVSPFNQVVRQYKKPAAYLLTIFLNEQIHPTELYLHEVDRAVEIIKDNGMCCKRPQVWIFHNIKEVEDYVLKISQKDKTFEGVVIRDDENRRWKIKSPTYLALHRMRGNGDNLFSPKHQLKFILNGEADELLSYFPDARDSIMRHKFAVLSAQQKIERIWEYNWKIEDQKEFALTILEQLSFFNLKPLSNILFNMRKKYGVNQNLSLLTEMWRESEDLILKVCFEKSPKT